MSWGGVQQTVRPLLFRQQPVFLLQVSEGNTVEYAAEVEQITDPNREPRVMEPFAVQW